MFISDMMEGKLTSSPLLMQKASAQPIIGHARTQRASIACYTASPSNRREVLAATLLASQWFIRPATAEDAPLDDCVDCLGEVNGGLNACTLNSPSCVSTQNDDEAHFVPPWTYEGPVESAVQQLIDKATGKGVTSSRSNPKISLKEAADYTIEEFEANLSGRPAPKRPAGRPAAAGQALDFQGCLEERHRTADGSEYLHFVLNTPSGFSGRSSGAVDAEFIFLSGDNVVDIRAASRKNPGVRGANLSLSLSTGLQYDTNVAKRELEALRKALRWEEAPVVTDFDPRYNQRRPLFFERLYQPFLHNQEFEDVVDK